MNAARLQEYLAPHPLNVVRYSKPVVEQDSKQVKTGECSQARAKLSIPNHESVQEGRWGPRRIMNIVDARILDACAIQDGCKPEIQAARENIARILYRFPQCPKPETINADSNREILIVWKSVFGEVEIDTGEKGIVEYYACRTKEDESIEGRFVTFEADEVRRVMSWLDESREVE